MRPVATPFRASSRSNGGPQFASTPRFFVSQRTPASQQITKDVDSIEEDDTQDTPIPTARFLKRDRWISSTPRQKETIEDSDDADHLDEEPSVPSRNIISDDGEAPGSSPGPSENQTSEFEDLFASIQDRKKRRRVSIDNDLPSAQPPPTGPDTEWIVSSSQDLSLSPPPQTQSPIPLTHKKTPMQKQPPPVTTQHTPVATTTPQPSAPESANPPSARNPRRFLFSASHLPPTTQPQSSSRPWVLTSTQEPPSSQRRKPPAFVLPRSPSPSHTDDELAALPTLFSPSRRALRRRGRAPDPAHTYLPDGMAAEVRSWVLETGTRHEQQRQAGVARRAGAVIQIDHVHQSSLPSCGPLAFVCGHKPDAHDEEADWEPNTRSRKLLLIGPPRSRPETVLQARRNAISAPELRPGSAVGICPGLTWDIDLGETGLESGTDDKPAEPVALQISGKWTVVLEWELVSNVDGRDSA
ncbi:uncharacterized protein BO97DRAFT_471795 [Aspergillus homomorphus CBS 101889]|uniref:Uncharacterized protein n=1 Tax=Aspergillus homomorphus (strain CBS 101889) TaxID=1450537 RepID=A0A395HRB9_ASPHC|nr:hypothetical protein BO97DRAFT_471795 [Aspergillus homomorphus CBS 101889]RAL10300.1 hypothetical protein BO97DRAFT_471795 [Aspergillus homomorphus CBS 101889]